MFRISIIDSASNSDLEITINCIGNKEKILKYSVKDGNDIFFSKDERSMYDIMDKIVQI